MSTIDQQFVEFVVKSLVGNPDDVKIARSVDEKGVLLELTVNPEDLGRVIGKRGATAQSMRTLLRALGTKNEARYNLKIIDNGEPRPPREDYHGDNSERPDGRGERVEPAEAKGEESQPKPEGESAKPAPEPKDKPAQDKEDEIDDKLPASEETDHSSVINKTRKELAELDDLEL